MAKSLNKNIRIANQAEVLRSYQRDNDFISMINESVADLLHRYKLQRKFSTLIKSDTCAKLLYFIFTSGLGNQTLGEEYTGIVQANLHKGKVPTLMIRVLAAVIECFGEKMLIQLIANLQKVINKLDSELRPEAKVFFNTFIRALRVTIPILIMVHRGLFYIIGRHYSIGRRLTRIDYVKIYGSRYHNGINWGLKILGFVTIAQSVFQFWHTRNVEEITSNFDQEMESNFVGKCQLCLEKLPDTATSCGHLFCWTCLAEWLCSRNQCPICRECVIASRIIPLMNL